MEDEDYDLNWRDRQWLQDNQLNEKTALDYFSRSHFYDKDCINQHEKDITKQK